MARAWQDRFFSKVNKTADGCWLWVASVDDRGHPRFKGDGVSNHARRFIWQKLKGPLRAEQHVHFTCEHELCVNPEHCYLSNKRNVNERPELERFMEKVDVNGPVVRADLGPCWIWRGRISPFGYGQFFFRGRDQQAHRVSWMLHVGPIADGLDGLHKCDVPDCVNPFHIQPDSTLENILDCHRKGRAVHPRGEQAGKSKLTERQVLCIRALYIPNVTGLTRLARIFKVTPQTIFAIVNRRTWTHI